MYLFLLSKENLQLARTEAERLHATSGTVLQDCLLLDVPRYERGLAFTREIHDVLVRTKGTTAEEILAALTTLDYKEVEPPFRVRAAGFTSNEKEFASAVWKGLERAGKTPSVDLKRPKTDIHIILRDGTLFITRSLWTNDDRFFDRRAHLRPANHPTSLAPKLARAMINLAGPCETILDPFCGSGGLLIEGCLANRQMTGTDLDSHQIRRAEENLAFYECAATLTVGDATTCDKFGTFDAIVTDLPYGKNSKLDEAETTFRQFFTAAGRSTKTLVVAANEGLDLERFSDGRWTKKASFSWYLHKSLSKRIFLFERPDSLQ